MMSPSKPIAIVTGAGAGIGRAVCKELAKNGMTVAAIECDPTRQNSDDKDIHFYQADVSNPTQVKSLINQIETDLGLPTFCVNNAGIIIRTPLAETPPDQFQNLLNINLGGTYNFIHFLSKKMIKTGSPGHFVNLSSGHAVLAGYNRSAYAASKAAIEALTRNAAVELGHHNILVNAIAPGFTFTEMSRQSLVGNRLEIVNKRLPIKRIAEAEEVAIAVHSLLTNKIPYMTGQVLRVDGGWSNSDVDYAQFQK